MIFYHSMDIPGYGCAIGQWDLRGNENAYLGNVPLSGKTVLEFGPASGGLTFYMERMGAKVTAYELSSGSMWDKAFPMDEHDIEAINEHIRELHEGFWFAHKAFKSESNVVYGNIYDVPKDVGIFDISVFGCILPHLRDPFLALEMGAAHTKEMMIVTDAIYDGWKTYLFSKVRYLLEKAVGKHFHTFLPNADSRNNDGTWWLMSPELVAEMLRILGFPHITITTHRQYCHHTGKIPKMFTVVARRPPVAEGRKDG